MPIKIAFYPHILDSVIENLYADRDQPTLRNLGLTGKNVHARVRRKLHQHVAFRLRGNNDYNWKASQGFVWDPKRAKARVLDVYNHTTVAWDSSTVWTDDDDIDALMAAQQMGQSNVIRFFSHKNHQIDYIPDTPGVHTVILNVDVPDTGFVSMVGFGDSQVEVRLHPYIPLNVLHLRGDEQGMGDFGFEFEAAGVCIAKHEICILMKQYDFGPRPKSSMQCTLLNSIAFSTLAHLSRHPNSRVTLVGMEDWGDCCGSIDPEDDEWAPILAIGFPSQAARLEFFWDWMLRTQYLGPFPNAEELMSRIGRETEAEFRERVGDEVMELILQPPPPIRPVRSLSP